MRCLVTGATGYLGGRLVPRLLAEGHQVRCLVRSPSKLRDVPWAADVEIVRGDVLGEPDPVRRAEERVPVRVHCAARYRQDDGPAVAAADRLGGRLPLREVDVVPVPLQEPLTPD